MERHWQGQKDTWFSYSWNAVIHATLSVSPSSHRGQNEHTDWRGTFRRGGQGFSGGHFSMWFQPRARGAERRCISGKVICQGSLRSGDIHHIVCEKHCLMPSFFFCLSSQQLVWIGVQFVLLSPFIRKLKMLPVYPGPGLFSFCWPRMGKEHIHCVSFHLMPLCICPNAPLFIYSPSSVSLPLSFFPFSCYWPPQKRERERENGSVQALYCTSLSCSVAG